MIQRPRLLAIDDDQDFRKWLAHVLRSRFFVLEAADGCEGYSRAIKAVPDIILLDQQMEGWDGVSTLQRMRQHPKLKYVPVLMLTADAHRETVVEAIEAGVVDYVLKTTVSPPMLIDKLLAALDRNARSNLRAAPREPQVSYAH